FPAMTIPMSAATANQRDFELGAIFGYDVRRVFYTRLVQATEGSSGFAREPVVGDRRLGGYARFRAVRATFLDVRRSAEFSLQGVPSHDQDFKSISISYEPRLDDSDLGDEARGFLAWLPRSWEVELGMGRSLRGPELDR